MATYTKIPVRSFCGCWTCRARKKKCDESRPICNTCRSLELECHGYGPKPGWMDNGKLQREKVLGFKHIVSQTKWKKGKHSQASEIGPSLLSSSSLSATQKSADATLVPSSRHADLQRFNPANYFVGQNNLGTKLDNRKEVFSIDQSSTTSSCNNGPIIESTSFCHQGRSSSISQCHQLIEHHEGFLAPEGPGNRTLLAPNTQEHRTLWEDDFRQDMMPVTANDMDLPMLDDTTWSLPENSSDVYEEAIYQRHPGHEARLNGELLSNITTTSGKTVLDGGEEDSLFMHYLDEVFYAQWPFYNPADKLGRAWLFSIIKQVKPAYYATLALSELHLLCRKSSQNEEILQLRAKDGYYKLALESLKLFLNDHGTLADCSDLIHSLKSLTCILQLVFWEVFCDGTRNWQALLHSASPFVASIVQARMTSNTAYSSIDGTKNKMIQNHSLPPEYSRAVCVLLGSFISLDIISAASTRSTTFLNIDHVHTLNTLGISLERLMGCRNSVMALINEVSALDTWKKEFRENRQMIIPELARRTSDIEMRLRQELADLENLTQSRSTEPSSSQASMHYYPPSHPEISKAYALSAIAYLHVVVSAPYPWVPEISQAVSQAIVLFQAIKEKKDPRLLRSLVWPFCVCGCLAREDEQNFFRELVISAAADIQEESHSESLSTMPPGTFFEAFKIMELCWEGRKSNPLDCDWASVMAQYGQYVLLSASMEYFVRSILEIDPPSTDPQMKCSFIGH